MTGPEFQAQITAIKRAWNEFLANQTPANFEHYFKLKNQLLKAFDAEEDEYLKSKDVKS